ncbi:MAG: helix-turn-helix domain-containing protein [Candidatus Heimdallarchaeota archaeon]|nr:helix-turn-helix domain-containing protein [Candidatus Heimdallarchaeota archaeon]MDH5644985.1 helix-turn-helix domain-containing protein [Candidatus Heimdallarchaeota archaeon]
MVQELRFKLSHECFFSNFAQILDSDLMLSYCDRTSDVIMINGELDLQNIYDKGTKIFDNILEWTITKLDHHNFIIQMNCGCEKLMPKSITNLIQSTGGVIVYPIEYIAEWEYYKVICLNNTIVSDLLKELGTLDKFEVLTINDLGPKGLFKSQIVSATDLTNQLTTHQVNIIIQAYENGYYEIPRRIKTIDLANKLGVSRYAVEKVIRRAENNIIEKLIPFLYFNRYNS